MGRNRGHPQKRRLPFGGRLFLFKGKSMYQFHARLYELVDGYRCDGSYWEGESEVDFEAPLMTAHIQVQFRPGESMHTLRMRAIGRVCDEIAENLAMLEF